MMHIGKLAKKAGTTTRTVRYYEEMGLIQPEGRTPGGFRCYSESQLVRLHMVLSLKEMGFELEHIKSILDRRPKGDTGGALAAAILEDLQIRLEEVDAQISHYGRMRNRLTQSIDSLRKCTPCEHRLEERTCPDCHEESERGEPLPFFHRLPAANGSSGPHRKKNKPSVSRPPSS